jgi:hypothetical protein
VVVVRPGVRPARLDHANRLIDAGTVACRHCRQTLHVTSLPPMRERVKLSLARLRWP